LRYLIYIFTLLIVLNYNAISAVRTSTQAGDFNNIATWVGGVVPSPTDDVIINHNVFISSTFYFCLLTCQSLDSMLIYA